MSFGVPAKPGITEDLIESDGIGRKAVADFIDALLVENYELYVSIQILNQFPYYCTV